jgi:hypothetical protein
MTPTSWNLQSVAEEGVCSEQWSELSCIPPMTKWLGRK